jgi:signal transduction histidine kinase
MTFRLVGLMSVVLLISLAAFALLMNYYQEQVMTEVAQTASQVGRETLRTLDPGGEGPVRLGAVPPLVEWQYSTEDDPGKTPRGATEEEIVVKRIRDGAGEGVVVFSTSHTGRHGVVDESSEGQPVKRQFRMLPGESGALHAEIEVEEADSETGEDPRRTIMTVIRLDDVRAVEADDRGLYLTIPTFRASGDVWVGTSQGAGAIDMEADSLMAIREEFQLQVPTGEFTELFSAMSRKSMFVFVGVFVLGTVLSTGLAARFTRPVRRLDSAIRQLSEGDLDARVKVRGDDEVARLGRAFNEMAGRLRVSRDRAREMTRREKLSALGRLAAGVAHDVRNPLHSIGLTLQHLQEACRPESVERAREFDRSMGVIRGEIRRLDGLVDNFLRFARSDRRDRVPTDLRELVGETVQLLEKEAERRGVRIDVDCPAGLPVVLADVESLRASVLNLALNSFEAMPQGGTLRLALDHRDGEVLLEVSDTGEGIPEDEQERVFEFAYTTRDGGNGLGLAMVHQVVVEEHAGRVWLESGPDAGTLVTLAFPIDEGAAEAGS